jgi:hypothetical protein
MPAARCGGSTTQRMLSENTARMGDEGKAVGCVSPTALLFVVHELEALVGPVHFDLDL